MTRYALVACPFCGGTDGDVLQNLDGLHAGVCRGCAAQGPPQATIGEAVVAWNDRAALAASTSEAPEPP